MDAEFLTTFLLLNCFLASIFISPAIVWWMADSRNRGSGWMVAALVGELVGPYIFIPAVSSVSPDIGPANVVLIGVLLGTFAAPLVAIVLLYWMGSSDLKRIGETP